MPDKSTIGRRPVSRPARLVLADDHDLARSSLRILLSGERGFDVVGEASNGREALDLHRRLKPDLMLLDVDMPDVDGLAVTRCVKERSPGTRVVTVTMDASPNRLLSALRAGADAYLLKGTSRRTLLDVLRRALGGEPMVQTELAAYLVDSLQANPEAWATSLSEPLSQVERDVLQACAAGHSRLEMARKLRLEQMALQGHLEQVLAKLGVVRN